MLIKTCFLYLLLHIILQDNTHIYLIVFKTIFNCIQTNLHYRVRGINLPKNIRNKNIKKIINFDNIFICINIKSWTKLLFNKLFKKISISFNNFLDTTSEFWACLNYMFFIQGHHNSSNRNFNSLNIRMRFLVNSPFANAAYVLYTLDIHYFNFFSLPFN